MTTAARRLLLVVSAALLPFAIAYGFELAPRQDADTGLLIRPLPDNGSWRLACALATPARPEHRAALRAIRAELVARSKSPRDIDEMIDLARWALGVLNPVNGTAQSAGRVHQVVADEGDIELALEVAQARGLATASELEPKRALLQRHRD